MLEVVFSDSMKGSMKAAKHPKKEIISENKVRSQKKADDKSIGGSPADVVSINFCLDSGDISGEVEGEDRKKLFLKLFQSPFEDHDSLTEELERYWQANIADLQKLKGRARNDESIRIWWSDAPYSICGYYFVCSILKDYNCEVSGIKLPKYMVQLDNSVQSYPDWPAIHPGKLYLFLPFERKISKPELRAIALDWEQLREEKAPLRAMLNGKLKGVPEDFYDYLIRANIPKGEFNMGRFIGEIMGKNQIGIGDGWYAKRIKMMIDNKEIEIVHDAGMSYQKILKKVK